MGSFGRAVGGIGAAVLAGTALTAAPLAAQAQSATGGVRVKKIECDKAQLSSAIAQANMDPATLRLAPRCTYSLTTPLPQITGRVTLLGGPSTTIRRDPGTPNLNILDVGNSGTLRVQGIFILNGKLATGIGAGIRNAGRLVLNYATLGSNLANGNNGGGLHNTGSALIAHSLINANAGQHGGGIYNDGTLTVLESRLTGNFSQNGSGIYTVANRTTRIIQSTIDSNITGSLGAGLYNNGTTSLDRTLVTLNFSDMNNGGGGIFNAAGTVTLSHSLVRKNSPDNCSPANSVPGCLG
jgi:hypothetical protein